MWETFLWVEIQDTCMKITIDTKEDSHQEIRKIIRMLSSLVGENPVTNAPDMFGDDESPEVPSGTPSPPTGAFANMFGGEAEEPKSETSEPDDDSDDDVPPVMEY